MTARGIPGSVRVAIAACAWLVPSSRRAEWRRQWTADLVYQADWLRSQGRRAASAHADLLARSAGAMRHALYLRLNGWRHSMLGQDLKFAWRGMRRRPGFTAAIVLTLGLAIGANATIFSWIDAVVLSPLPTVPRASDLVLVRFASPTRPDLTFSYLNYRDARDAAPPGLQGLAVMDDLALTMRTTGEPERVWSQLVSGNFFDVLGVPAARGRVLRPDDERAPGLAAVAVISDRLWRTRFAADPSIVGGSFALNGHPFTIVGIAPRGFVGGMGGLAVDVWVPVTMHGVLTGRSILEARGTGWLTAMGRRDTSIAGPALEAAVRAIATRLEADHAIPPGWTLRVAPLSEEGAAGELTPMLSIVMGTVVLVLLIACANISGLLLSRGIGRQREVAIRAALGGSRFHLARQLLVESLMLAALGGALGVAIAVWTSRGLDALLPPMPFPVLIGATMNVRVLLFSVAVMLFATIAFGLAPAIQNSRTNLQETLRASAAAAGTSLRRARVRRGLVAGQVALAMVLLVCTGLFVRTLLQAYDVDPGFSRRSGVLAAFDLSSLRLDAEQGRALLTTMLERVRALSGVESASVTTAVPLSLSSGADTSPEIEGYTPQPQEEVVVHYSMVGSHYFETMGIPIRRGRGIDDSDRAGSQPIVVINETMARRYWAGRDALGGRLRAGGAWMTVVGVVKDGKYRSLTETSRAVMYLPIQQVYRASPTLVAATRGAAEPAMDDIRRAVASAAPELALYDVRTLEEHLKLSVVVPRIAAVLLGLLGGLALALAAVGLYGVVAFVVGQRTREIGVRLALGARHGEILGHVLRQGLVTAGIGLLIGLVLALAASPALGPVLVNVRPTDPLTYGLTTMLLLGVAALATWLPARRAAAVDPVEALRSD